MLIAVNFSQLDLDGLTWVVLVELCRFVQFEVIVDANWLVLGSGQRRAPPRSDRAAAFFGGKPPPRKIPGQTAVWSISIKTESFRLYCFPIGNYW